MRAGIPTQRVPSSPLSRTHIGAYIVFMTILLATSQRVNTSGRHLYLGALLPQNDSYAFSIRKLRPVFDVAIETVERELLSGYRLSIIYGDSGADIALAPHSAFVIYSRVNISGLLGPVVDDALAPVARQAHIWGLPVITEGGVDQLFDNRRYFSSLVRLGFHHLPNAILKLMAVNKWTYVKLLYTERVPHAVGMNSICYELARSLTDDIDERKKDLDIFTSRITEDYDEMLVSEVGRDFAIVVLCAPPEVVRLILAKATQLRFNNGHYVFIVIDLFRNRDEVTRPWFRANNSDEENNAARESYEFVIQIAEYRPIGSQQHDDVASRIKHRAADLYKDTTFYDYLNGYMGVFYDAVILFGKALNDSIAGGHSIWERDSIAPHMVSLKKYMGITGPISFDKGRHRYTEYSILDTMASDPGGRFHVVANYHSDTDNYHRVSNPYFHWGHHQLPDVPRCAYDQYCEGSPNLTAILISVIVILCVGLILVYFIRVRRRVSTELGNLKWRIKWDNVILERHHVSNPTVTKKSTYSDLSDEHNAMSQRLKYFTDVGVVNGVRVSVKFVKRESFTIDKVALGELRAMVDIHHDHICRFIGACIDTPNQSIMSEYCSRGSLRDILEDENIALDWVFRFSIVQDIVKGMSFIHDSFFRSHGDLTSTNCLIDSRFVIKITDFGLHFLRDDVHKCMEYARHQRKLWTAPELLRMYDRPAAGTQKGDVYSFAIIYQEIVYRKGVFYVEDDTYVSDRMKYDNVVLGVEPYFRPTLCLRDCSHECFYDMVVNSWSEDPEERPSFNGILRTIWKLNKHEKTFNLLDNLLTRMETYATDLETLVKERSAGIIEEKERADNLLHLLLPRSVAHTLINGLLVPPESYDSVTIFLGDIVGFTALSASCTPIDTICLLNDLYTRFDSISDSFDVYKMETIGDAYMVVSGLPIRNGIQHAGEIAGMALAIHCATLSFRIAFRPEAELRFRIGVHTGPVCTGVLGHKMPRYCLIGRTVTEVTCYEASCISQKIHISEETKKLLDEIGGFVVTKRGEIDIKSIGRVTTYWLVGGTFAWDSSPMAVKGLDSFPPPTQENFHESLRKKQHSSDRASPGGSLHDTTTKSETQKRSFNINRQTSLNSQDKRIIDSMQSMFRASGQLSQSTSSRGSQKLTLNHARDIDQATSGATFSGLSCIPSVLASEGKKTPQDTGIPRESEAVDMPPKTKRKKFTRFRNTIRKQISPVIESSLLEYKLPLTHEAKRMSIPENTLWSTRQGRRRSSVVRSPSATPKYSVSPQPSARSTRLRMMRSVRQGGETSDTRIHRESWESRAMQTRRSSRRRSSMLKDIRETAKPTVPSHIYPPIDHDRPKSPTPGIVRSHTHPSSKHDRPKSATPEIVPSPIYPPTVHDWPKSATPEIVPSHIYPPTDQDRPKSATPEIVPSPIYPPTLHDWPKTYSLGMVPSPVDHVRPKTPTPGMTDATPDYLE